MDEKHLCVECSKKVLVVDRSNYDPPVSTTDANILYNMAPLIDMVNFSITKAQKYNYDKTKIIKLNNADRKQRNTILEFSHFEICADNEHVRQDSIINKTNNRVLITYPNKSQFNVQILCNMVKLKHILTILMNIFQIYMIINNNIYQVYYLFYTV